MPKTSAFAFIWFVAHLLVSSLNDVATKWLVSSLPGAQLVFGRFVASLIWLLPVIVIYRKQLLTQRWWLHALRGALLFIGITLWSCALGKVQMSMATVINFTLPFYVLIMARYVLGEKISTARALATVTGFVGAVITMNPFGQSFVLESLLLVFASLSFASLDIVNKKFVSSEPFWAMILYSSLFTSLIAAPVAFYQWQPVSMNDIVVIMVLGLGANLLLFCLLRAFTLADASALSPLRYLELVFAAGFGYIFFADVPELNTILGAAIIIPASAYVIYNERKGV